MLSKNQIKYINSLKLKKFRDEENMFVAEGTKIVTELLNSSIKVIKLYATSIFIHQLNGNDQLYKLQDIDLVEVSEIELRKISNLSTPNEVLLIAEIPKYDLDIEALYKRLTIVLDDMRDPGNLGTIIRTAHWFGIENIICSNDSVDAFNPKVVQATMGSIANVKVHYCDLEELFKKLKNNVESPLSIYGALLEGDNIYEKKLMDKGFILIGNESRGISEKLLPYVTDRITIPQISIKNSAEKAGQLSLNASIATAIICSKFRDKEKG